MIILSIFLLQTVDGRIHFDANMFWTAGLLYKHFDTTGIESWDAQLDEMRTQFTRPPPPIPQSTTLPPSYPMLLNYPQKPPQFVPIPTVFKHIRQQLQRLHSVPVNQTPVIRTHSLPCYPEYTKFVFCPDNEESR